MAVVSANCIKMILLIALIAVFPTSYAYTQTELLNAQDNYQSTRSQYEDAKKQLTDAKKELSDAQKALSNAQADLKLKQKNLNTAQTNLAITAKAFTTATTKVNAVWGSTPPPTSNTNSKTNDSDN